jgi:D-alanyl-D-alanine carboxypeptidase
LLDHSSGFAEYGRTFFGSRVDSCEEAAALGLSQGLETPPGTAFRYSNMNYCILGLLVEEVTGEAYEDVVQERLLQPLDIDGMRLAGTHELRDGDVTHLSGADRNYMEVLQAAGSWVGTASDLVRIVDSLDVERDGWHPLGAEMVQSMLSRSPVPYPFSNRWYGLGLRVWVNGAWGHTGTVENAASMVLHRPDGLTWAVMVNGDPPGDTDDLRDMVDTAFAEVGIPS